MDVFVSFCKCLTDGRKHRPSCLCSDELESRKELVVMVVSEVFARRNVLYYEAAVYIGQMFHCT